MKKIFKWMVGHVRPYAKYVKKRTELHPDDDSRDMSLDERVDDFKERGEVGIKFKFKF